MESLTKRSPWEHLATELWIAILDNLSKPDHAALSSVSWTLNRVVEPTLYASFSWFPSPNDQLPQLSCLEGHDAHEYAKLRPKERLWLPGYGPSPYRLLRTLLHVPRLALHFKHARVVAALRGYGCFQNPDEAREGGLSIQEFEACKGIIANINNDSKKDWLEGLRRGTLDVVIALVLSKMSQLKTIEIKIVGNSLTGSIVLDALIFRPYFTREMTLRYINISAIEKPEVHHEYPNSSVAPCYENSRRVSEQVMALFDLPKLESLSVARNPSPVNLLRGVVYGTSSLKKLCLRGGRMDERILDDILQKTPDLEELDVVLTYYIPLPGGFDCERLQNSLEQVSTTLRTLKLNIYYPSDNIYHRQNPFRVRNTIKSMKKFKKLKKLEIPLITLIPPEPFRVLEQMIPENLETFMPLKEPTTPSIQNAYMLAAAQREVARLYASKPSLKGYESIL